MAKYITHIENLWRVLLNEPFDQEGPFMSKFCPYRIQFKFFVHSLDTLYFDFIKLLIILSFMIFFWASKLKETKMNISRGEAKVRIYLKANWTIGKLDHLMQLCFLCLAWSIFYAEQITLLPSLIVPHQLLPTLPPQCTNSTAMLPTTPTHPQQTSTFLLFVSKKLWFPSLTVMSLFLLLT